MSPRQFARVFNAATGFPRAKTVARLRVEAGRTRVRQGAETVDHIARETGFSDAGAMRRAFIQYAVNPPRAMRRAASASR